MAFKTLFCSTESNRKTQPLVTWDSFLSQYTAPSRLLIFVRLFTRVLLSRGHKVLPLLWLICPILTGYRKSRSHGAVKASWTAMGKRSKWSLARWAVIACRTQSFRSGFAQPCNNESKAFPLPLPDQRQWKPLSPPSYTPVTHVRKYLFSEVQPQTKNILIRRKVSSELHAWGKHRLPIIMLNCDSKALSCGSSSAINSCYLSQVISSLLLQFLTWESKSLFVSQKVMGESATVSVTANISVLGGANEQQMYRQMVRTSEKEQLSQSRDPGC